MIDFVASSVNRIAESFLYGADTPMLCAAGCGAWALHAAAVPPKKCDACVEGDELIERTLRLLNGHVQAIAPQNATIVSRL